MVFPLFDSLPIVMAWAVMPQVRAMYGGDYARKKTLVEYGFRLPSAFDNRPLKFEEVESKLNKMIFVSATPGDMQSAIIIVP